MVLSAKQLSGFESVRYQFVYVDSDVLSPSSWNLRDTNSSSPHRSGWYICLLQIIGMFFCLDRNVDDWRGANFQAKKKSSRDSTETLKTGTANEQRWAEGGTRI